MGIKTIFDILKLVVILIFLIVLWYRAKHKKTLNNPKSVIPKITIPKGEPTLTRKMLLNTEKDLRWQEITWHIFDYEIDWNIEEEYEKVLKMPKGYQMIYMIDHLVGEVNNGGYYQYFSNFEDNNTIVNEYYQLTTDVLKMIGYDALYKDYSKAVSLYSKIRNCDDEEKQEKLARQLEKFDSKFYNYDKEFNSAVDNYIDTHIDEFISK